MTVYMRKLMLMNCIKALPLLALFLVVSQPVSAAEYYTCVETRALPTTPSAILKASRQNTSQKVSVSEENSGSHPSCSGGCTGSNQYRKY